MAECYRCGSELHFIQDCDYRSPAESARDRVYGWSHGTQGTYLAELEDTEGHPLAMRVKVGERPNIRPQCQHKHSRMCEHQEVISDNGELSGQC